MFDFSKSEFFDHKRTIKYLKNPWEREYRGGKYFSAINELGCPLNIQIGLDLGAGVRWYQVPHGIHDGYSALYTLLSEQGVDLKKHEFKLKSNALGLSSMKAARSCLMNLQHQFVDQHPYSADQDFFYRVIKTSSTKSLGDTAIVVHHMANFLRSTLLVQKDSKWMIPVRTNHISGLQASYFGLMINESDTVDTIRSCIKNKLSLGEHHALKALSKIPLILGKKAMLSQTRAMLERPYPNWAGSLSNLKNLGRASQIKDLIMLAPVRWHRPIGLGMYQLNGIQYLTIAIHKSLAHIDLDTLERSFCELS